MVDLSFSSRRPFVENCGRYLKRYSFCFAGDISETLREPPEIPAAKSSLFIAVQENQIELIKGARSAADDVKHLL